MSQVLSNSEEELESAILALKYVIAGAVVDNGGVLHVKQWKSSLFTEGNKDLRIEVTDKDELIVTLEEIKEEE